MKIHPYASLRISSQYNSKQHSINEVIAYECCVVVGESVKDNTLAEMSIANVLSEGDSFVCE